MLQVDESELTAELEELEQEELNKRLEGASSVPLHAPQPVTPGTFLAASHLMYLMSHALRGTAKTPAQAIEEDEEERELRELQAQLAM